MKCSPRELVELGIEPHLQIRELRFREMKGVLQITPIGMKLWVSVKLLTVSPTQCHLLRNSLLWELINSTVLFWVLLMPIYTRADSTDLSMLVNSVLSELQRNFKLHSWELHSRNSGKELKKILSQSSCRQRIISKLVYIQNWFWFSGNKITR